MTLEGKARSLFWLLFFGGPRGRVAWAHRGLEFGETGLPATRTRSLRGQSRPRRCRHCPAATQSSRAPSTTPLSAPQAPCASLTRFLAQGPRLLPQTLLLCSIKKRVFQNILCSMIYSVLLRRFFLKHLQVVIQLHLSSRRYDAQF